MAWPAVTDKQWHGIEAQFPRRKRPIHGGRPPLSDRQCFEGILWILWTGAPWSELPARYGSKSAVHRRLSQWAQTGVLLNVWRAFLDQLNDARKIRGNEGFVDGMFIVAKKGARVWARPNAARGRSLWFWQMARVLRSEYAWRRRPHRKSSSSPLRLRASASRVAAAPAAARPSHNG
jgi:transposase